MDEYIAIAKEKHGYNMEQVTKQFKNEKKNSVFYQNMTLFPLSLSVSWFHGCGSGMCVCVCVCDREIRRASNSHNYIWHSDFVYQVIFTYSFVMFYCICNV